MKIGFGLIFMFLVFCIVEIKGEIMLSDGLTPEERSLFLRWSREEKWKRHIDRERFREELVRRQ